MNASYHVVDLVRKKISNEYVTASDTEVANALGISRAVVSAYKRGVVMSAETLEKAQEILKLPPGELWEISTCLTLESSPETKAVNAAHRWMQEQAKRWGSVAKGLIVPACLATGLIFASPENTAFAAVLPAGDLLIMRLALIALSLSLLTLGAIKYPAWHRFLFVFPVAILSTGCSALQTTEERTWLALHAIDSAQTYRIAQDEGRCYHEANAVTSQLIGETPSRSGVVAWSLGSAAAHAGITELLLRADRPRLAKAWQYVTLGATSATIGRNYGIGIRLGAPNRPRADWCVGGAR